MAEKYLLFDLNDQKSKEIATILSNESARKILSYLSEHDGSESDVAKALSIPLSTAHYNIQNLLKNDLLVIVDTLYSQKGNKINMYRAARKAIVLAPHGISFTDSLKEILPLVGIAAVGSFVIYQVSKMVHVGNVQEIALKAAPMADAGMVAESLAAEAPIVIPIPDHIIALWFFVGAVFIALLSLLFTYWRRRR